MSQIVILILYLFIIIILIIIIIIINISIIYLFNWCFTYCVLAGNVVESERQHLSIFTVVRL